jgi:uncharacterized protein (DUF1015 family)
MPQVYPFRALQYQQGKGDVSKVIAPPYDVLDKAGKAALLARDANNIVGVDLPHTPAKELGPAEAYQRAADTLRSLIMKGGITKSATPAMFAYRQTFQSGVKTYQRCGMACTVEVVPFGPRPGGGVLAHEETFSGPKEDRMALMQATRTQLSPIFGLHADEKKVATNLVRAIMSSRQADLRAESGEGVQHEVWTVTDAATIKKYEEALKGEDVFIADGHHRYTTQINYLQKLGNVPADHPARRSMMVLVSMSDPGLVIWPTHRVLGGMSGYSWEHFCSAAGEFMRIEPVSGGLGAVDAALHKLVGMGAERFGLYDFKTGAGGIAVPAKADSLSKRFPEKPRAWRQLSVAFCQYVVVEQVCQGRLNGNQPVKWAFPHTIEEVRQIGSGQETGAGGGAGFAQLAVIVLPTPLSAVRDVSRANVLMPQKSTFFYPKLATGLFLNALE